MVWSKKVDPATTTATQFAGDYINKLSDYLSNVDIGASNVTDEPKIKTKTRFRDAKLGLSNPAESFNYWLRTGAIDTDKDLIVPVIPVGRASDELLLKLQIQTPENKVLSVDKNTLVHDSALTSEAGALLKLTATPLKYQKFLRGATDDILKSSASDVIWGKIVDGSVSAHTTTKISTLSKSLLNSQIVYADQNNAIGPYYLEIQQSAIPSNPASGRRRLFVHSTDGVLKVVKPDGTTQAVEGGAPANDSVTDAMIQAHTSTKITISNRLQTPHVPTRLNYAKYGGYTLTTPTGGMGMFNGFLTSGGVHSLTRSSVSGIRARFTTGSASGTLGGLRTNDYLTRRNNDPQLHGKFNFPTTQCDVFVGFMSGTIEFPVMSADPLNGRSGFGLWINTGSFGNFKIARNDGTGATVITDHSIATILDGTTRDMSITCDDAAGTWTMNLSGIITTYSTDIPATGTDLFMIVVVYTDTGNKDLDIRSLDWFGN